MSIRQDLLFTLHDLRSLLKRLEADLNGLGLLNKEHESIIEDFDDYLVGLDIEVGYSPHLEIKG